MATVVLENADLLMFLPGLPPPILGLESKGSRPEVRPCLQSHPPTMPQAPCTRARWTHSLILQLIVQGPSPSLHLFPCQMWP